MTATAGPYGTASFRRMVAERLADSQPALAAALLGAARVLQHHGICPPLRYAGDPPRPIELTATAIAEYLTEVHRDREAGLPSVFRLSGEARERGPALFLDFESTPAGSIDVTWVALRQELTETTGAERLSRALAEMCLAMGAYHGAAEDEQLMQLYRGVRATERARSAVPPELRQFVPEPLPPGGAGGRLPSLLVPQEFDRRRVPDAVWWINFWDAVQVQAVGRSSIDSAGFTRVIEHPSGALLLIATDDPVDVSNTAHTDRLARIIDHLDLRGRQERARS